MNLPRFRIRTLMATVAVVGVSLAALCSGPIWLVDLVIGLTGMGAVIAFSIHYGRKLGINTLFR